MKEQVKEVVKLLIKQPYLVRDGQLIAADTIKPNLKKWLPQANVEVVLNPSLKRANITIEKNLIKFFIPDLDNIPKHFRRLQKTF